MIVCSCTTVSDHDIELALLDLLNHPEAPIPTPGLVFRHLSQRMSCCGCAPLAVETIYAKMDELVAKGLICPCACATVQDRLGRNKNPVRADRAKIDRDSPAEVRHDPVIAAIAD
jgi:hypothetical protein